MNWKTAFACLVCVSAAALTGCGGIFSDPEYKPIRNFDFGVPAVNHPASVDVSPFSSDSSARYKMQFRYGNELKVDEMERWVQPPAAMLTRYLRLYFSNKNNTAEVYKKPKYKLNGSILVFEANPPEKKAVLSFRYEIFDAETDKEISTGVIEEVVPYDDPDGLPGEDFAAAMKIASEKSAEKLSLILRKLPQ